MKKLRLKLEALTVASFETAETFPEQGTVQANAASYWYSQCTACLPEPTADCTAQERF